jgi:manganese/zinc/iron transport system permease protein
MIDAIGHSIVFGIAAGFLLSHSLNSPILFICAIISAFLMNLINEYLQKNRFITIDSSLGISFSTLFAIGILLISLYARNIHLDLDMILLGNIEYSLYDTFCIFSYFFIPKIIIFLFIGIIFFLIFLSFFYQQIHTLLFDKEFAKMINIPTKFIVYIFITSITILTVITFNAMGSLLLLGIAVAPFGFSWHKSISYLNFIKDGIFKSILWGSIGIIISIYANTSIAATITFLVTTGSLITYLCNNLYL